MLNADYFFTTKPSDIQAVFVSDLHLSPMTPRLTKAFVHLLEDLKNLPNLNAVYLLGDWLDAWLGDDTYTRLSDDQKAIHWLHPVITALNALANNHIQILVMRGNRDFMIRQTLCDTFKGALIQEPYPINTTKHRIRLEHGDALCTDDTSYQRYRAIINHPMTRMVLNQLPLSLRKNLANHIQNRSRHQKSHKPPKIMNVNPSAVDAAMTDCDILLHGHTHRPNVHHHGRKIRIVLGDWRDDGRHIHAEIGLMIGEDLQLAQFKHG
ncbi:UDP-2,3-diacylglucosamine hydrolase [Moraxella catarrhalis]|uniref:UDP-2,3-diacylglucosamine diphosphatase n=1 Tax=Moraxella catarrhalis TaxID=480 RepID=UPI0007E30DE8|nr:UDP-2,3-diacylglucosamine diphosphatase [Moraxella catarrhalis]OAV28583.1 UDP-2,3-diacylglucosamine hydrolase [Moraxella catarrhalis]